MQSIPPDPAPDSAPVADPAEAMGDDWSELPAFPAPQGVSELESDPSTDAPGAETGRGTDVTAGTTETTAPMAYPDRGDLLTICREMDSILASVLLFAGIAYSVFGFTLFQMATILNVGGLGVWAGWWVGKQFDATTTGMILGGLLAAAAAWPALRYTIALCGGIVGFVVGVSIWRALGLADPYAPAGGLIGATFLFMLSFIHLRITVMTFTAVQGAVMLLAGLLGLLMKYPEIDNPVTDWVGEQAIILPVALFAVSVMGLLFQQHHHTEPPAT